MNKTKLGRLAAALALLGTASFGAMAEWTFISDGPTAITYADPKTIRRSGQIAKMWIMHDFKSPTSSPPDRETYLSTRSRIEVDCSEERMRTIDASAHSGNMAGGSTLMSGSIVTEWSSIAPRTINEAFYKLACEIK